MKRKLLSIILSVSLIMGLTSATAFAESQRNDIRSTEQLKAALSEDLTESEQAEIVEQTDKSIVNELLMEKLEEAATVLENQENYADMKILPDGSGYDAQTYDLGDGCTLTVELRDSAEKGFADKPVILPMESTTQPDQWKDYGDRYFSAKASVSIGNVTASMSLKHHYTLSVEGIEAKRGEAKVEWEKSNGFFRKTDPIITDRYAKTVGASDVNIECTYNFSWILSGKIPQEASYILSTAVGYIDIDRTARKIKVRHSWNLSKV